jgi:DNA repair exonuclease SbcCD nuclease subunit
MTIDILSDLHIDAYFAFARPQAETVKAIYSHIFLDNQKRDPGDVLIIAGDIGHHNTQNIKVLEHIKELFGYKHIICVLGNHDYYLINKSARSNYFFQSDFRAERMRDMINQREGMHCLNGETVEIDGVRFGGCDGWYDGEYIKKNFEKICPMWNIPKDDYYINELWKNSHIDSRYIHGINWQEYAQQEKQKIEKIYKDIDVMISHINPSILKEHTTRIPEKLYL